MPRILLTAFEPVDQWRENSSWLTLIELTRWFEANGQVVTRRYPSDLTAMSRRLTEDLRAGFDIAIHLGQSPGTPTIQLESTGQNKPNGGQAIVAGAQPSYRSLLPLGGWTERLLAEGIPANVSHQPATLLGNATLFLSHHIATELDVRTQCCFIHLPVAPHQVCENMQNHLAMAQNGKAMASMSLPMMAYGISIILKQLMETAGD